MALYVLDTDIAGFLQSGHQRVLEKLRRLPEEDSIITTMITFGEDLSGWMPDCRRAPNGNARRIAYLRLQKGLEFYLGMHCLPFDDSINLDSSFRSLRRIRHHFEVSRWCIRLQTLFLR